MCDLLQEAALFKRLQTGDNTRRRVGEAELLRLLDSAVAAEVHQRFQEVVASFV
jgi:hypothetical protein